MRVILRFVLHVLITAAALLVATAVVHGIQLLAGTTLPYATRAIVYGLVMLGAVMALRERRN